ncbi:hypothetical protein [Metakosakonia massiliensis]
MPRNFFNILRDNPESWGGKQNPLTLPTTRSSDKAEKSSAAVKISAVCFLCYKHPSLLTEGISNGAFPALRLQPVKGKNLRSRCGILAGRQAHPHTIQRALFYVKKA